MTVLRGHALPTGVRGADRFLDHTYVTCSGGHAWPCWGSCQDGEIVTSGTASSAQAHEISQPNSQAGIRFLVTGVCHQTANRILWPAGVTVNNIRNYGLTVFVYGHYGRDAVEWIQRQNDCADVSGEISTCDGTASPGERTSSSPWDAFLSVIQGLYETFAQRREGTSFDELGPDPEFMGALWAAQVRYVLGADYPENRIQRMQGIQDRHLAREADTRPFALLDEYEGEEVALRVNAGINDTMRQLAEELEPWEYGALFHAAPGREIGLAVPEMAARAYAPPVR
jgi:hypothetical protein